MTYSVRLHTNARRDFYRAQAYYDAAAPDQTERFIADFLTVAERLGEFPHASSPLHGSARRANLHLFPYQVWYRVREESKEVEILAVLHHRQDAAQFSDRLL